MTMDEREQLRFDGLKGRAIIWMGEVTGENYMVDVEDLLKRVYERGKQEALASK